MGKIKIAGCAKWHKASLEYGEVGNRLTAWRTSHCRRHKEGSWASGRMVARESLQSWGLHTKNTYEIEHHLLPGY